MSRIAEIGRSILSGARWGGIDPQAVRAEAWALGGRHQGRLIEGAEAEMSAPGLPPARVALLKAVVRSARARAPGDQ